MADYLQGIDTKAAKRAPESILAFLELHDEQGPLLQDTQTDIGIVENIVAIAQLTVSITGFAGHAGTVPMHLRQDAGLAAYAFITQATQHILQHYPNQATFTVGKLSLLPGSSNCIPNNCDFTIDLRSGKSAVVDKILTYLNELKKSLCKNIGLRLP